MKPIGVVCQFAIAALLAIPSADASVIAYEGFTPSFPVYANGGVGFTGPWIGTPGDLSFGPQQGSLCYQNLATSPGSLFAFGAGDYGATRAVTPPLGTDNTTVYISFLIKPAGPLTSGLYEYFGLAVGGLFIGKPGMSAPQQYVIETYGGAGQVPSGVAVAPGRTTLLVVKAQFLPGNDLFTLYVNPRPGHPEPTSGVTKSDLDVGLNPSLFVSGVLATSGFSIDEIRIGTTYADVVPAVSPSSFGEPQSCQGED